jgi:hypothetical protein
VSKFLLNLLVEILKVLPNSKSHRNLKSFSPLNSSWNLAQPAQSACARPSPRGPPPHRLACRSHVRLWCIWLNVFSFSGCAFHPQCLLSLPSLMCGPHLLAPSSPTHAGRSLPCHNIFKPPPATPCHPGSSIGCRLGTLTPSPSKPLS